MNEVRLGDIAEYSGARIKCSSLSFDNYVRTDNLKQNKKGEIVIFKLTGPYDNRLMRSIDKQLKEKKWFEYQKDKDYKYLPLEKAGQHHTDFLKFFYSESESIQFLIDTQRFYEWSKEKKQFNENEVKRFFSRMRQFYKTFPISAKPSHQLSWSHYVELLKIDDL